MQTMRTLRHMTAVLSTAAAAACAAPTIQSVRHDTEATSPSLSPDRNAEIRERNRIVLDRPDNTFTVSGVGTCGRIRVRFGDDTSLEVSPADLGASVRVVHTYSGWGGPKKVTAEIVIDCVGRATTEVLVEPTFKAVALDATTMRTACVALPGVPPVREGSRVTVGDASNGQATIRMGGLVPPRGIDGSPEVALGPPFTFPFPGLKAHSLVLRINGSRGGSQIEQGGVGRTFVATVSGPLELCVNDDNLFDNRGAWGVTLAVDERGAEP